MLSVVVLYGTVKIVENNGLIERGIMENNKVCCHCEINQACGNAYSKKPPCADKETCEGCVWERVYGRECRDCKRRKDLQDLYKKVS